MKWSKNLSYLVFSLIVLVCKGNAFSMESISYSKFQSVSITNFVVSSSNFCQSSSNPDHTLTFTVQNYTNLQAGNAFSLELSDASGSFTNSTILNHTLTLVNTSGTSANYSMLFSFPSETYGNNYRLRVRTSSPAALATSSVISAYNLIYNQAIPLNFSDGSAAFCTGSSITISIIDTGNPNTTPLTYDNLIYIWRKKNTLGGFDVIPNQTDSSLLVNSPGVYFVEINYGSCTSSPNTLSQSNQVTVTEVNSTSSLQINTENGETEVCESIGVELLLQDSSGNLIANGSNISWFLGGTLIPNANSNTYIATQGGSYTASLNNGSCTISVPNTDAYILDDITFNATLNVSTPYEIQLGENFDAIVTTDAIVPTFEWTSNGTVLSTSNTLNITTAGQYTVIITETSGCISTIELNLLVIEPSVDEIPNLISPNNDGSNDKFKVPYTLTSANNLSLEIYNSSGKLVYETDNYQNTWPENEDEAFQSKAFFYFKLSKDSQIIKEGILTVIK